MPESFEVLTSDPKITEIPRNENAKGTKPGFIATAAQFKKESIVEKVEEDDETNLGLVDQLISKKEVKDTADQSQESEDSDRHPPIEPGHRCHRRLYGEA